MQIIWLIPWNITKSSPLDVCLGSTYTVRHWLYVEWLRGKCCMLNSWKDNVVCWIVERIMLCVEWLRGKCCMLNFWMKNVVCWIVEWKMLYVEWGREKCRMFNSWEENVVWWMVERKMLCVECLGGKCFIHWLLLSMVPNFQIIFFSSFHFNNILINYSYAFLYTRQLACTVIQKNK